MQDQLGQLTTQPRTLNPSAATCGMTTTSRSNMRCKAIWRGSPVSCLLHLENLAEARPHSRPNLPIAKAPASPDGACAASGCAEGGRRVPPGSQDKLPSADKSSRAWTGRSDRSGDRHFPHSSILLILSGSQWHRRRQQRLPILSSEPLGEHTGIDRQAERGRGRTRLSPAPGEPSGRILRAHHYVPAVARKRPLLLPTRDS